MPTTFGCAVCPKQGDHREIREVATPLYGEIFGTVVTGPTRRLCSKHAWVPGRQLSGRSALSTSAWYNSSPWSGMLFWSGR